MEKRSKAVTIWLLLCCFMVLLMVGIGGFTRLTRAGLSITEWRPITGILPPLSEQDWVKEKLKYESMPEYKVFNYGMKMKDFQTIYVTEYIHRLAARLTGVIFVLPFIYFVSKKQISKKFGCIVISLGMLQAFAGWYMVKSGLVVEPHVSHYRLALHLLLALIIFALLLYQLCNYQMKPKQTTFKISYGSVYCARSILVLITIQIFFGALVAGLNAGLVCNDFPLMCNNIIPSDLFFLRPLWLNVFENRITVQFIHRILGFLILTVAVILTVKNFRMRVSYFMLFSVIAQVILGVITLLFQVPITIAILHQVFSFITFASGLYFLLYLKRCRKNMYEGF